MSIVRVHRRGRRLLARKPAVMHTFTTPDGFFERFECTCGWQYSIDASSRLVGCDAAAVHMARCKGVKVAA